MVIIDALLAQFEQRFQYEKRANVCLWFDEKQEFARILPRLQAHLTSQDEPPFVLLRYEYDEDKEIYQGQIWLKHQIYLKQKEAHEATASGEAQPLPRFILYLPFSEDRLTSPDEQGQNHLDLLEEYRIKGVIWRIGGKRPTLFTFLRQAGIELPKQPAEQRKLYEGGQESLLARYVAKFVDSPRSFWETPLTVELVQNRLVGDVAQTLFDLAEAPQTTWHNLREQGLDTDFLEMVEEQYGFAASPDDPEEWVNEFVSVLALTETFQGCSGTANKDDGKAHTIPENYDSKAAEFPFGERLPPPTVHQNHVNLLRRWLRDSQSRPTWDQRIQKIEESIDLSAWAADQPGLSFAFPHLVSQRWERVLAEFERSADKASTTREFFTRYGAAIAREVEFSKASESQIGSWGLLQDLGPFLDACSTAEAEIAQRKSLDALVKLYVEQAGQVDRLHLKLRFEAMNAMLPSVERVADRHYASYTKALNQVFFNLYTEQGSSELAGIPVITSHLEDTIWQAKGKRAVVIVDALRYDCAEELKSRVGGLETTIEPARTLLPTVTPIGMTALMPLSGSKLGMRVRNNKLQPLVNDKDMFARKNRLEYLRAFGADCRDIDEVEGASKAPEGIGDLLVVYGHEEVDEIGHSKASTLIRHLYTEIDRLVQLIRKLHSWGYEAVHVVTDHGFILLDEAQLPPEADCKPEWCKLLKERYAIISAEVDLPQLNIFPCEWEDSLKVAVPPGLAFFKAEKSFSHGGATLQELVVPHLTSRVLVHQTKRISVEVVVPKYELMQATAKVILRGSENQTEQMTLFPATGRSLSLNVYRQDDLGKQVSVLPKGQPKTEQLESGEEKPVTMFFQSSLSFQQGEKLILEIWDTETLEKFPPGGITLTLGRNIG